MTVNLHLFIASAPVVRNWGFLENWKSTASFPDPKAIS